MCAVRFSVLGELFTVGSLAGTIVSVASFGRASVMLEDHLLKRFIQTLANKRTFMISTKVKLITV